jgi:trigger factor
VLEYYRNQPGALDNVRAPIFENKVIDYILEIAEVADRPVPISELMAEEEEEEEDGEGEAAMPAPAAAEREA